MHINDNLEASYKFDGNGDDSSGEGNNAAGIGVTYDSVNQKLGTACASFDGNDYFNCGNITAMNVGSGPLTWGVWLKTNDPLASASTLIGKQESASNGFTSDLGLSASVKARAWIANAQAEVNTLYNDDQWHFYVAMRDSGGVLHMYIDNVLKHINGAASGNINTVQPVTIGAGYVGSPVFYFTGLMDSAFLYSRALTDGDVSIGQQATGEIGQLWNGGAGLELPVAEEHEGVNGGSSIYDKGFNAFEMLSNGHKVI
jgi:hypothetical protein